MEYVENNAIKIIIATDACNSNPKFRNIIIALRMMRKNFIKNC